MELTRAPAPGRVSAPTSITYFVASGEGYFEPVVAMGFVFRFLKNIPNCRFYRYSGTLEVFRICSAMTVKGIFGYARLYRPKRRPGFR